LLSVQNLEKFTRIAGNGSINKAHMILNMSDDSSSQQQLSHQHQHHHHYRTKAKDTDQMSIASSTHFTLINGCGRANLKSQNSFCRHGRQITILVVTMTTLFTIGILGILYLMDRKSRVAARRSLKCTKVVSLSLLLIHFPLAGRAKSMPAYHQ
jgi:hypothetical protein